MAKKEFMVAWRHPVSASKTRHMARAAALVLLSLALLATSSCVRRKDEPGYMLGSEGSTLSGQATLVCEEQCRGSGQCGTIEADWVVMASSISPTLDSHDLTFPDRSAVTIISSARRAIQSVRDPSQSDTLLFYWVEVPDRGMGWVAGWCIGQQVVP